MYYNFHMNVISKRTIVKFYEKYAKSKTALEVWYADTRKSIWLTPNDIKKVYADASFLSDNRVIFNIKGSIVGLRVGRVSKIVEFDEADFTLVKSSESVNNKVIIEKSIIIDNEIILFAEFNEDLV